MSDSTRRKSPSSPTIARFVPARHGPNAPPRVPPPDPRAASEEDDIARRLDEVARQVESTRRLLSAHIDSSASVQKKADRKLDRITELLGEVIGRLPEESLRPPPRPPGSDED